MLLVQYYRALRGTLSLRGGWADGLRLPEEGDREREDSPPRRPKGLAGRRLDWVVL